MATTVEVDAAMTRLRSARLKLQEKSQERANVVARRARAQSSVDALNAEIVVLRTEVQAATEALRLIIAQQET
jgi:hypothetical protein